MREISDSAHATKDCGRCGARALYWRSAIVLRNSADMMAAQALQQPAWTCMHCGYIEPHERRSAARPS
jgi:hypothetical protein